MIKRVPKYLLFALLFTAFAGCKRTQNDMNAGDNSNLSNEIWKIAGVAGQVINEQNQPVQGAAVKFGNQTTTTDANGYFRFTQASFNTSEAFVTVNKTGYFTGSRTFIPRAGSNNYIKIQLLAAEIAGSVDAGSGGTVSISNNASIMLPANGIINSHNDPVAGKVTVFVAYIDPTSPGYSQQIPGNLIGISTNNQQKILKSFGIMAVELRSSTNEILNIRNGYKATLTFPVPPALSSLAPASVPLWSFDKSAGMWKQEGEAVKQGSFYSGAVSHFTFWNVGNPADYVKLSMRLISSQGQPVEGAMVQLTSSSTETSAYDYTDNLGYVDGYVPANEPLHLQAFDNCQNEIFNQDIPALTSDKDLGDITLAGNLNLQTISGTVQDCGGHPLADGTLEVLLDNTHFEFTNIKDGSFSLTFLNCTGTNTVNLVAMDESNMQKSTPVLLVLSSNQTDAGVLQACGVEIQPFFNVYIDGVEQTWPNTVFGGWISTDASYGDNSNPVELFKGDTTQGRLGLDFDIKLYNPIHVPDSATLISISVNRNSPTWYQAIDQYNFMVKFDLFGDVGKIIEGNFNGSFAKLYGCCPTSTVLDTVNIKGEFRFRRDIQWWNH